MNFRTYIGALFGPSTSWYLYKVYRGRPGGSRRLVYQRGPLQATSRDAMNEYHYWLEKSVGYSGQKGIPEEYWPVIQRWNGSSWVTVFF